MCLETISSGTFKVEVCVYAESMVAGEAHAEAADVHDE